MITQHQASRIATDLLIREGIVTDELDEVRWFPVERVWVCYFLNPVPPDAVDCPSTTMVIVDSETGEVKIFDSL